MDNDGIPGLKPPFTDAQRALLIKVLDGSIADFLDLENRYQSHLGLLMNEVQQLTADNPSFDVNSHILDDLCKWSSLFSQLAKRVQQQADLLGIDCSSVLQPVILGHESFVAEIRNKQSERQIEDHQAIFESQMKKLKLQAEIQKKRREEFWNS